MRALFAADLDELGCRLLRELLPCSRTADAESTEIYLKEPYVMAGDVYSGALAGRGGWTWYTGAAGWMYRTIVECYYGLRVKNGSLTIRPHMTEGKATVRARINGCDITAEIEAHGGGEHRVCVDGAQYGTDTFVLLLSVGQERSRRQGTDRLQLPNAKIVDFCRILLYNNCKWRTCSQWRQAI